MLNSPRSIASATTKASVNMISRQSSAATEADCCLSNECVTSDDPSEAEVSREAEASAAQCKSRSALNPKAPAFAPSQTLMNDHPDPFSKEHHFHSDPPQACVMPSQDLLVSGTGQQRGALCAVAMPHWRSLGSTSQHMLDLWSQGLMSQQVDTPLTAFCPEPNRMSQDVIPPPPGLEECFCSSPYQFPVPSKTSKQYRRGRPSRNSEIIRDSSMKNHLEALHLEDPTTVFIARGIKKLGFSSAQTLKFYFGRYGEVKAIYTPLSRLKSKHGYGNGPQAEAHWRLCSAPVGFVVMKSSEAVARILADGPEQIMNGVTVRLQPFYHWIAAPVKVASEVAGE